MVVLLKNTSRAPLLSTVWVKGNKRNVALTTIVQSFLPCQLRFACLLFTDDWHLYVVGGAMGMILLVQLYNLQTAQLRKTHDRREKCNWDDTMLHPEYFVATNGGNDGAGGVVAGAQMMDAQGLESGHCDNFSGGMDSQCALPSLFAHHYSLAYPDAESEWQGAGGVGIKPSRIFPLDAPEQVYQGGWGGSSTGEGDEENVYYEPPYPPAAAADVTMETLPQSWSAPPPSSLLYDQQRQLNGRMATFVSSALQPPTLVQQQQQYQQKQSKEPPIAAVYTEGGGGNVPFATESLPPQTQLLPRGFGANTTAAINNNTAHTPSVMSDGDDSQHGVGGAGGNDEDVTAMFRRAQVASRNNNAGGGTASVS